MNEKSDNEIPEHRCPICKKGKININTYKCDSCHINLFEANLARISALIDYRGTGMSTHAGIIMGICFGLFSIAQILFTKELHERIFRLSFLIFIPIQFFGFYEIHRFTSYRLGGIFHEKILSDWKALSLYMVDYSKLVEYLEGKKQSKTYKSQSISKKIEKNLKSISKWMMHKPQIYVIYGIFLFILNGLILLNRYIFPLNTA